MQKLLVKLRDYLLILAFMALCSAFGIMLLKLAGWTSIDGPADFAWSVGLGTAGMVFCVVGNHYGERLWRWLGLDAR